MKNNLFSIIKKPRVTEKSGIKAESQNVYTFEVAKDATKKTVAEAINKIYKVKPVKVNITVLPSKSVVKRGKKGTEKAIKKAIVFLKKGDKIAFI